MKAKHSDRFIGIDQHARPDAGPLRSPLADRLLKLEEVMAITTLGKTSIYTKVKEGAFPAPLQLGERAVAWRESEVSDWMQGLARASMTRVEA